MISRLLPLNFGLLGIFILSPCLPADGQVGTDETPVHTSLTALGEIGSQFFTRINGVDGGVTVESDAAGNYYHATGPKIAKYNSAGELLWSQSQSSYVFSVESGGLTQFTYYDRWTDDHGAFQNIQLGSGFYSGDLASCYAQKIVLDASGDVYVSFLDLDHRDRSVLGKFDGTTGEVEWVSRVGAVPESEPASSQYFSQVAGLAVLPDQSVAVLETGIGNSRHGFTRLVIFASEGASQNGVPLVTKNRVFRNDGGSAFRVSLGIGLAVAADGTLFYATYEGDDTAPNYPVFPAPYPAPVSLVMRRLAPPYTGTPLEVAYTTGQVRAWNDIEIGPGGTIYTLGTTINANNRREPVLAGFDASDFSLDLNLTFYRTPNFFGIVDLPGIDLFSTGTEAGDSLYLATGTIDHFRENEALGGGWNRSWPELSPTDLFVTKVNSAGAILWQKHELLNRIYDVFTDPSDNVYFIGDYYGTAPGPLNGASVYKYSPTGKLQVTHQFEVDGENDVAGRFSGLINSGGDIVVAFPQLIAPAHEVFESCLARFANPVNVDGPGGEAIDFPDFSSSAFPGDVLTLTATAQNGQPVGFQITFGDNISYINGNSLVLQGAGVVSVRAYQFIGGEFVFSEVRTLAVFKRPQTIAFRGPGSQKFKKNKKFNLSATSTSGLAVAFSSSDSKTVRVAGSKATIRKKGSVTITASQPGDAIYRSATPVKAIVKVK